MAQLAAAISASGSPIDTDARAQLAAYLKNELDVLASKWDAARGQINTAAALIERNRFVRDRVRAMLGSRFFDDPLEPKITRVLQRDGYRVENLLFRSRHELQVTGNLYVPEGNGHWPGIISPCGHYELARMYPDYQCAYVDLVRSGFVVLAYDPIGQGERRHYAASAAAASQSGLRSVDEHSMCGQLLLLLGEGLTGYLVDDGRRAIDYLLTRHEVDGERIGCAGHSGGGTLTMFLACADERIKCVVINEGGTFTDGQSFSTLAQVYPSRMRSRTCSPLPSTASTSATFMSRLRRGRCSRQLKSMPQRLTRRQHMFARDTNCSGFPNDLERKKQKLDTPGQPSCGWRPSVGFADGFRDSRGLRRKAGSPLRNPKTFIALQAAPYVAPGPTIFSVIRRQAERLPQARPVTRAQIRHVLRIPEPNGHVRARSVEGTSSYELEPEPGIRIPVSITRTSWQGKRADPVLYVGESAPDLSGFSSLVEAGIPVISGCVRGIAAERPTDGARPFDHLFDFESAAQYMAWYMDRCLFGMRVFDVLRTIDFVSELDEFRGARVRLIGKGMGALWTLYAAALDDRVSSVICDGGLISYRMLTRSDRYLHNASIFVRDVLRHFDLPDVARLIEPRRLVLLSPVDEMKRPVPVEEAQAAYRRAAVMNGTASGYLRCL